MVDTEVISVGATVTRGFELVGTDEVKHARFAKEALRQEMDHTISSYYPLAVGADLPLPH
jgi:hypothetical protein